MMSLPDSVGCVVTIANYSSSLLSVNLLGNGILVDLEGSVLGQSYCQKNDLCYVFVFSDNSEHIQWTEIQDEVPENFLNKLSMLINLKKRNAGGISLSWPCVDGCFKSCNDGMHSLSCIHFSARHSHSILCCQ